MDVYTEYLGYSWGLNRIFFYKRLLKKVEKIPQKWFTFKHGISG